MPFTNTIIIEDVIQVARQLNFNPTLKEMDRIVEMFAEEQDNDLTATWNLVIEQLLYSLEVEQIKPNES